MTRPPVIEIVAHRGDPVGEPENTVASIRRAIADGARVVEVDVRLSAEGTPVLLHDATTERLWGRGAPVGRQSLAQLRALRAVGRREAVGIPTLAEALAAADGARLLIDLPDRRTAPVAWEVAHASGAPVAWCGDLGGLRTVRRLDPGAELWLTWHRPGFPGAALLAKLRPHRVNPFHRLVNDQWVRLARRAGVEVSCWTVDDIGRARRLADSGVAAIISNRAASLRSALQPASVALWPAETITRSINDQPESVVGDHQIDRQASSGPAHDGAPWQTRGFGRKFKAVSGDG